MNRLKIILDKIKFIFTGRVFIIKFIDLDGGIIKESGQRLYLGTNKLDFIADNYGYLKGYDITDLKGNNSTYSEPIRPKYVNRGDKLYLELFCSI